MSEEQDLSRSALAPGEQELLEADFREAIRITPEAIEEEFARLPGDLAFYSAKHARAIGLHLRATAKKKRLQGLYRVQARAELEAELDRVVEAAEEKEDVKASVKPKKSGRSTITESMVDARVESYVEWREVIEEEIDAEVEREQLKGRVAALAAKRDMLIQLGASLRAEAERDPVIRERRAAARGFG